MSTASADLRRCQDMLVRVCADLANPETNLSLAAITCDRVAATLRLLAVPRRPTPPNHPPPDMQPTDDPGLDPEYARGEEPASLRSEWLTSTPSGSSPPPAIGAAPKSPAVPKAPVQAPPMASPREASPSRRRNMLSCFLSTRETQRAEQRAADRMVLGPPLRPQHEMWAPGPSTRGGRNRAGRRPRSPDQRGRAAAASTSGRRDRGRGGRTRRSRSRARTP